MAFQVENHLTQATFTVTLGCLVENGFQPALDAYPIFDETYRKTLNDKILARYWFREIGQETPALFNRFLARKMNEVMPYYNQIYEGLKDGLDPFINQSMTTEGNRESSDSVERNNQHTETSSNEVNADTTAKSGSRVLNSATPQNQLSRHDDYATALTDTESDSTSGSTSTESANRNLEEVDRSAANGTEEYITRTYGLSGITQAEAFSQYARAIVNVDLLVLEDLAPLFMGLYTDYANFL